MIFLSDIEIDGYTGDIIRIIKDDSNKEKPRKKKSKRKQKKENEKRFNKLANKTAVCMKFSAGEVAVIKSVVSTKKSKYSDISGKQEVNKASNYQKRLGGQAVRFRRDG